jgi:hypothetical protein
VANRGVDLMLPPPAMTRPRLRFTRAYRRVRLWIRRHGAWPAERDVRARDRVALECLYARQVAVMERP